MDTRAEENLRILMIEEVPKGDEGCTKWYQVVSGMYLLWLPARHDEPECKEAQVSGLIVSIGARQRLGSPRGGIEVAASHSSRTPISQHSNV